MTEMNSNRPKPSTIIKREGFRRKPGKITPKVKDRILKKYESGLQSGKLSDQLLSSLASAYGKSKRQIERYIQVARAARVPIGNIEKNPLIIDDKRRHFKAVWQAAREWSKQIYYFESEDDFGSRNLFPTAFTPDDARLGSHQNSSLEWKVQSNGSVEVSFEAERDLLFGALREHLLSEELWKDYEGLKSLLAKSIKQAGERNTRVGITDEFSAVRQRFMKELERLLEKHKHWFPGKCSSCP
jgi:hypothetical protein